MNLFDQAQERRIHDGEKPCSCCGAYINGNRNLGIDFVTNPKDSGADLPPDEIVPARYKENLQIKEIQIPVGNEILRIRVVK